MSDNAVVRLCARCGVAPCKTKQAKFCSRECFHRAMVGVSITCRGVPLHLYRSERVACCKRCGGEFRMRSKLSVYCSAECAYDTARDREMLQRAEEKRQREAQP